MEQQPSIVSVLKEHIKTLQDMIKWHQGHADYLNHRADEADKDRQNMMNLMQSKAQILMYGPEPPPPPAITKQAKSAKRKQSSKSKPAKKKK